MSGGEKLRAALDRLDVRGRIVFVHNSWTALSRVVDGWLKALDVLRQSVGDTGTLVMPTYPMRGLSQAHLEEHPFFDCRRTPSQVGLLTEIFRRMPGAHRSVHPTHPVAAVGARAVELTEGHQRSLTPFDRNSPFHRMYEAGAVVLNLGVHNFMSFRHLADHLMQQVLHHDIYSEQVTSVRIIDCDGVESHMKTRGHNPFVTCNHEIVLECMRRGGCSSWLQPLRWIRPRGVGTKRSDVGSLVVEWIPVRPYVAMYHRCYRSGKLRFFRRENDG